MSELDSKKIKELSEKEKEIKKVCSIRLKPSDKARLEEAFGSVQKAIDVLTDYCKS